MKRSPLTARAALLAIALVAPSQAYYHYVHYTSGGRTGPFTIQQEKFNVAPGGAVTFFVNDQGPAVYASGDSFGSLLGQVKQALAAWDAVASPNLRVKFGGLEPAGQTSSAPAGDVVFQELPPGLLGMGGPVSSGTTIVRGTVILTNNTNAGTGPSFKEGFFTTAVHEVGHALGLQHTWTGSAMSQDLLRNTSRAKPLDADDVAAINVLYGAAGWQNSFGTITGTVRFAGGGAVTLASVVALSPTGAVVSALTNPDGTYRIDGIPAGNYQLYVHPLPPDAVPSDGTGLRPPVDQNGQSFLPNGYFATIFYPNITDASQLSTAPFAISPGTVISGQDFTVQPRTSVPAYDLTTYSYLDRDTHVPLWNLSGHDYTEVSSAIANNTMSGMMLDLRGATGDVPVPQSATALGGLGTISGQYVKPFIGDKGTRNVRLYFGMAAQAGTGPRHLVLNYGSDMYVMPQAINLVKAPFPVISMVSANADGSVTVTGSNFGGDSLVYFDGIQASRSTPLSGNYVMGTLTVTPPPGNDSQVAQVMVFNGDGQNSTLDHFVVPPTHTYPSVGAPQILSLSLSSLPVGGTGVMDIVTQGTAFNADGQVTLGFGTPDVVAQRVWVKSPTHLMATVAVSQSAAVGSLEVSITGGFEVLSAANAFQVTPQNPSVPVIGAVTNAISGQQTIYPDAYASVWGANLAASPSGVQVTLNGQPMRLQSGGVLPGQVNFYIPAGFPTGPALLALNNGSTTANPILFQVDVQPPVIQGVSNGSGVGAATISSAAAQDVVNVIVSGLDPTVFANLSRVQVAINGQFMTVQSVTQMSSGLAQISFALSQGFGGAQVALTVVVDGSSSLPYMITVR